MRQMMVSTYVVYCIDYSALANLEWVQERRDNGGTVLIEARAMVAKGKLSLVHLSTSAFIAYDMNKIWLSY